MAISAVTAAETNTHLFSGPRDDHHLHLCKVLLTTRSLLSKFQSEDDYISPCVPQMPMFIVLYGFLGINFRALGE